MVIGFKLRFVRPYKRETKIHTLRQDKMKRWKVGMLMHMAIGVRTKKYRQFGLETCKGIERITMLLIDSQQIKPVIIIMIEGITFTGDRWEQLAINDGFASFADFEEYWLKELRENKGEWSGRIIHWTDFKYFPEVAKSGESHD